MGTKAAIAASTVLALLTPAPQAHAFCGFYVSGSNKKMFNDATNVVLMRSGTRTVLSMQNDYRGPLEDFAMVIPVPVVLKPTDVKVVPKSAFDRLDSLSSPRLVEYWEQDPCPPPMPKYRPPVEYSNRAPLRSRAPMPDAPMAVRGGYGRGGGYKQESRKSVPPVLASFSVDPTVITANVPTPITWTFSFANQPWPAPRCTVDHGVGVVSSGARKALTLNKTSDLTLTCANAAGRSTKTAKINVVTIEAKFDVAEYQILILSATEAAGLEQWLKLNNYKIPEGAEPLLRPYIESGSKFFVAKVNPKKVQMVDGRAALSPLRFHYDTDEFSLPIRLGMANSSGKQDLIVNIVSPDKRYEVANYKNITIPTNFDVKPAVKERFAEFYAALFDRTLARNPGAVITEYAWTSRPTPPGQFWGTGPNGQKCDPCPAEIPEDKDILALGGDIISQGGGVAANVARGGFVLTRLHARYGKNDMKDDLRFREAKPIVGGREHRNAKNELEYGSAPSPNGQNFFQARYAIRYWWTGAIKCQNPRRGVWGPPPGQGRNMLMASGAAKRTAFAPRGKLQLASVVKRDVPEAGVWLPIKPRATQPKPAPAPTKKVQYLGTGAAIGLLLVGLGAARRRRRKKTAL